MSFKKMDPSCTIGFYCETKAEFEKFRQQTTEVSTVNKHYYPKQDTAFFIKNILQHHQLVESFAELSEPIWIPSPVVTFAVIRATPIYGTILQPNQNKISTLSLPFFPFPSSFKFPSSPSRCTDQPVYWHVTIGRSYCCDTNKLCSLFHGPWQWLCPSWPQNKKCEMREIFAYAIQNPGKDWNLNPSSTDRESRI